MLYSIFIVTILASIRRFVAKMLKVNELNLQVATILSMNGCNLLWLMWFDAIRKENLTLQQFSHLN